MGQNSNNECKVFSVISLLQKFDKDNVETSEMMNELLYDIVSGKSAECFLQKVGNDTILHQRICNELENPIDDCIDLDVCTQNLQKYIARYQFAKEMIDAIEEAKRKYGFQEIDNKARNLKLK